MFKVNSNNTETMVWGDLLVIVLPCTFPLGLIIIIATIIITLTVQKQPSKDVLRKGCSENMQQSYSNFIEIALRHGCSPVNLLHIFRTPFPKNISEGPLLTVIIRGCPQVLLLLISEFTQVDKILFPLKSSEKHRFSDASGGYKFN